MTRDDRFVAVQGVANSGEVTTVYNWRIADHRTYFVGSDERAFCVWAHNEYGVRQMSWIERHMLMGTEGHHPVFQAVVRAFQRFGIPDPGQALVTLTRNFHQDFLHPIWRALYPTLTSTRQLLAALRNGSETPTSILNKLANFYKQVVDDPALRQLLLDSLNRFRNAIGH